MAQYVSIRDGMTQADQSDLQLAINAFATEGVVEQSGSFGLTVTENGSPNMSVNVASGEAIVTKSAWTPASTVTKFYHYINTATVNLVIAANGGATRIDLICVKIDEAVSPNADASNAVGDLVVVQGVSGAGVPATPSNHLKLAEITVGNGVSQILNANITDKRFKARIKTGLLPYEGFLENGKISRTVASNNLTLAIKTLDDQDPSPQNPVRVRIANTVYYITAALSVSANAGTNWMNMGSSELATFDTDFFVYLGVNAGSVFIGFSRIPYGRTYADFNSTSTNEKYLRYSGSAPSSTDRVVNIGRFNAILGVSASYNWSIPASDIVIDRPIYETRVLNWLPTQVGFSVVPTAASCLYEYRLDGDRVFVNVEQGANGTSNATSFTLTAPLTSTNTTNYVSLILIPFQVDGGTSESAKGHVQVGVNSNILQLFRAATVGGATSATGWTNSGNKRARFVLDYRI